MTLRDTVWHETMQQLVKTGQFKISELPFDESQRHTVRRTLRKMETLGWLSRDSNRDATWRMGEQAELHLNVSAKKIEAAQA